MVIIQHEELKNIREKHKNEKIVVCTGTFDITHAGHILFLEDCKKQGDILVVSVGSDSLIKSYKGEKRPILNQYIRIKTIDSLKPVDYTILDKNNKFGNHEDTLEPLFKDLKPNIYAINEDGVDLDQRKEIAESHNVELRILNRYCPKEFDKISTTKIINNIIKMNKEENPY